MADQLDALLDRLPDLSLRDAITAQVVALKGKRRFGLVFEDQPPESVHLPSYPIRRGLNVLYRSKPEGSIRQVHKVCKEIAMDRLFAQMRALHRRPAFDITTPTLRKEGEA